MVMACFPSLEYVGVDPYAYDVATDGKDDQLADLNENDEQLRALAEEVEAKYNLMGPRAQLWITTSEEASHRVADGSLDGVFIDGDHSYKHVRRDLEVWEPKIRPGGFLSGHDFGNNPQVAIAVADHRGPNRAIHLAMDWVWYWRVV